MCKITFINLYFVCRNNFIGYSFMCAKLSLLHIFMLFLIFILIQLIRIIIWKKTLKALLLLFVNSYSILSMYGIFSTVKKSSELSARNLHDAVSPTTKIIWQSEYKFFYYKLNCKNFIRVNLVSQIQGIM